MARPSAVCCQLASAGAIAEDGDTSYMAEPEGNKRTLQVGQILRSLNELLQRGQTLGMARLILFHDRSEQPPQRGNQRKRRELSLHFVQRDGVVNYRAF